MVAMNNDDICRRDLLLLGAFAACAAAATKNAAAQAAPGAVGAVRALSGRAEAEREAQMRLLAQEGAVFTGDRITTAMGARAVLGLGAATELRMGSGARIRIDRFLVNAGGVIDLDQGAVLIDKTAGSGGALTLRSSHGLIAVRGTRFFAGPSGGVFGIFVERGSVAVSGAGRQVLLGAGEGTDIATPGSPPTRPARWGQARIQVALGQVY
jgi:ferric-dicitrate binding protein FerR (iron transport regulator)